MGWSAQRDLLKGRKAAILQTYCEHCERYDSLRRRGWLDIVGPPHRNSRPLSSYYGHRSNAWCANHKFSVFGKLQFCKTTIRTLSGTQLQFCDQYIESIFSDGARKPSSCPAPPTWLCRGSWYKRWENYFHYIIISLFHIIVEAVDIKGETAPWFL